MVIGLTFLVFLGREESRIRGERIGELDIQPLLYTDASLPESELNGKVVVLHFWGYWCGPCVMEYPGFAELQQEYRDASDVLFVSVACDGQSPENEVNLRENTESFLKQNEIGELPIYWDPAEFSRQQISHLFKAGGFAYPTTLVVNREGKIADVWRGAIHSATLKKSIEATRKL